MMRVVFNLKKWKAITSIGWTMNYRVSGNPNLKICANWCCLTIIHWRRFVPLTGWNIKFGNIFKIFTLQVAFKPIVLYIYKWNHCIQVKFRLYPVVRLKVGMFFVLFKLSALLFIIRSTELQRYLKGFRNPKPLILQMLTVMKFEMLLRWLRLRDGHRPSSHLEPYEIKRPVKRVRLGCILYSPGCSWTPCLRFSFSSYHPSILCLINTSRLSHESS